jgi:hypothetical protein
MHALMAAILLGMAGLKALDLNPEAEPPDGELAEPVEGVGGGKRDPIVGADRLRQARRTGNDTTTKSRLANQSET